jgi:hypothetical protein
MLAGVIVLRRRGSAEYPETEWRPRFAYGVEVSAPSPTEESVVRDVRCPDLSAACRMADHYEELGYVAELRYGGPTPTSGVAPGTVTPT